MGPSSLVPGFIWIYRSGGITYSILVTCKSPVDSAPAFAGAPEALEVLWATATATPSTCRLPGAPGREWLRAAPTAECHYGPVKAGHEAADRKSAHRKAAYRLHPGRCGPG